MHAKNLDEQENKRTYVHTYQTLWKPKFLIMIPIHDQILITPFPKLLQANLR